MSRSLRSTSVSNAANLNGLNEAHAQLLGPPRGKEVLTRTRMKGFGELEPLIGSAIFSRTSSRISAASFGTGTLPVDGGYLARGLNQ